MPILEVRAQCSDAYFAQIEALRGTIALDDFLRQALSIGIGHLQEEVINQQRQRAYESLTLNTDGYRKALELHKLERAPTSGTVTPFGSDMTRPKAS